MLSADGAAVADVRRDSPLLRTTSYDVDAAAFESIRGAFVTRTYSRREALRVASGFGALAAGGWLGIACGGGSDGAEATPTPPPILTRPEDALGDRSGRLRLGVVRTPDLATQPLSRLEQMLAYSRLVAVDPRDASLHADLANEFEVVEPLVVRFSLRPGVFFHPDTDDLAVPVTADSIKLEFERLADEGVSPFADVIDQVEVPDSSTLVLRLRAPFALLFDLLAAPEASIRGQSRYGAFAEEVGSGPFVPAGQDSTGHALLANERYHDVGLPRLEQVNVLHFEDEAELDAAFAGSEMDIRRHPSALSLERTIDRPGTQQLSRPARTLRGLGLSMLPSKGGVPTIHVEAFQDERVRRAVSYALDRSALAAADGGTIASPVGAAHGADSLSASELATNELYQYDPIEAVRLLEAATDAPVEFRVLASPSAGSRTFNSLIEGHLREVGFDTLVRVEDQATWSPAFFAGNFEAALFELSGLNTPDIGLRLHMTGGLDGRFSLWGYSNPVFDAAATAALSELIPSRRAAAMRQSQRVLLQEAPGMFPLATPNEFASVGPRVSGYEFDAFDFNAGWLAAQWERPA